MKHWKNKLILIIGVLVISSPGIAQEKALIAKVNQIVDLDFIQEEVTGPFYTRFNDLTAESKPRVAIRLCTSEPIHLALMKSALPFPGIIKNFVSLGYAEKKIIVLRSTGCRSRFKGVITSEVWAVFGKDQLPAHDDAFTSDQIDVAVISRSNVRYAGDPDLSLSIRKLTKELKENDARIGVILSLYRSRRNDAEKAFPQIRKSLRKQGIKEARVIFQTIKWGQELSPDSLDDETLYPSFFVVNVKVKTNPSETSPY
jgi:hypothetical protein